MDKEKFFISLEDKKFIKKRALIIIATAAVAFIVLYSLNLEEIFNMALSSGVAMASRNRVIGALVFTVVSSISVLVSPFSSAPLVPLANVSLGNFSTILLLLIGWITGDVAAYYVGSWAGYPILSRFVSSQKIENYKGQIPPTAQFWLVLMFRLAIPAEITGYTLGIIRYPFVKYILASFLSEIPFALILVYSSQALIEKETVWFLSLVSLGVLLISVTFLIFKNKLRK